MFYEELSDDLESVKEMLPNIYDIPNREEFLSLLESINDEVEKVSSQSKSGNYRKAYKNILLNSNKQSFENESFFIQILPSLTELEIKFLYSLYQNKNNIGNPQEFVKGFSFSMELAQGSLNRLNNYGLVSKQINGLSLGGSNSGEDAIFQINDFGSEFIMFIFE